VADDRGRWFVAPADWEPEQPNPFSADGTYEAGWSCFRVSAADDDRIRNGCQPSGLYHAAFGRRVAALDARLGDFLRYETSQGRQVIVACPADMSAEALIERGLQAAPSPTTVRPGDPRRVVHSTPLAAWSQIEACGELRSFASLRAPDDDQAALGELLLGDPPDYAHYIALGLIDAIGPEFVVACRQAGRMLPDPDTVYQPGVRLYFDAQRIIQDGLAVRDGLHALKVRDRLPLGPYLVAKIAAADLPPLAAGEQWTTTLFLERANEAFGGRSPESTPQDLG
jgi:hypothetical protein